MRIFKTLDDLASCVGQEVGVSPWHTITQSQIDAFALATLDSQWIHVDAERAKEGPFGSTIAHGFLTLSLMPWCMGQVVRLEEETTSINYGLNKVRFPSPVPVGSRVRGRFKLLSVEPLPPQMGHPGAQIVWEVTIEREGSEKPVCVAETVTRRYG